MNRRNITIVLGAVILGALIITAILLWLSMSFLIELWINQSIYFSRLGIDWFRITLLEGVGIFLVPAITVILLCIVTTIQLPFRSGFLKLGAEAITRIRNERIRSPPWYVHVLVNYGIAIVVGLIAAFVMIGETTVLLGEEWTIITGNIDFALYTVINLGMNLSAAGTALLYPFFPGVVNIDIVFMYVEIWYPLISLVLWFCFAKIVALLAYNVLKRSSNPEKFSSLQVTGLAFLLIFVILAWGFASFPVGYYDYLASLFVMAVFILSILFLFVGIGTYVIGIFKKDERSNNPSRILKSCVVLGVLVGFFTVSLFGMVGFNSLFATANWHSWTWSTQISTQIDITRKAADINGFNESTMTDLINSMGNSEQTLRHIRQYDYGASRRTMQPQIGSTWEVLADSDIVFLPGQGGEEEEFWVAPRAISPAKAQAEWIDVHYTYSHSRGFVAMRASSSSPIVLTETEIDNYFGVNSTYPIYFGESFDNDYFLMDAHIYTDFLEQDNLTYPGEPDVTLSGLLGWLYIEDWGFKSFGPTRLVVKRNVSLRVEDMLLKNLKVGDDPYLVFNNNRTYYVVDIILDYPKFSYMECNLMRWLGFCLIDVQTGEMSLYKNPNLDLTGFNFAQIYMLKYPWKDIAGSIDWITSQLKYPETLYENQLEVDYIYHVQNSLQWRTGEDFFERPSATDLHHVMYNIGTGMEFVGTNIVELLSSVGENLAGLYMIRYGTKGLDNLGKSTFYRAASGTSIFVGISTAIQYFNNEATQNLTLIQNKRYGNFLLYPFEGSLWYVIPVYSETGTTSTLQLVGLVDAFTQGRVYYGATVQDAYAQINVTTAGNVTLSATAPSSVASGSEAKITCEVTNNDIVQYDVTLNISLNFNASFFNDYDSLVHLKLNGSEIPYTNYNQTPNVTYHIANWTLIPDEFRGIVPRIMVNLTGSGLSSLSFSYVIELFIYNGTGHLKEYATKTLFLSAHAN
ncbi:MAG: UPF0182 family protein [Candidatus Helarchaeota archaeon]